MKTTMISNKDSDGIVQRSRLRAAMLFLLTIFIISLGGCDNDQPQSDADVDETPFDGDTTTDADADAETTTDAESTTDADDDDGGIEDLVHPRMLITEDHRESTLARLDREPYSTILTTLQERAAREYEPDDPKVWTANTNRDNAKTAQAAALLAWLYDDEAMAEKAREFFVQLEADWETNDDWDINIRMPGVLMPATDAWDLLMGTPWFPEAEAEAAAAKLTEITSKFFDHYLGSDFMRQMVLGYQQNNHPIRTATAIGYVAIAFPGHPESSTWANWAFSELDYLWSTNGHYVQPDGVVSEGPFYFDFGWGVSTAFFIAVDNCFDEPPTFLRDCRNRQDTLHWADHGCVDDEPFTFENPLNGGPFWDAVDWSISIRLPWGIRPPLADANFNAFTGAALLTHFDGGGRYRWDWENNRDRPYQMTWGADLTAHHLIYFNDSVAAVEPDWTTRFFEDGGHAVFRSDWSDDARWLLLVAEAGASRMTLHDHVDGTSFTLAAYGEYLLMDTGYYKADELDNAATAQGGSHNLILIDGQAAPDKGLLHDFGDADAWIRNTSDGTRIDYAEAHQEYQDSSIERSVLFVEGRYFVVCDRITTALTETREHAWRLHGHAGFDTGGTFTLRDDGGRWERDLAGVDVYVSSTSPGLTVIEPPYVELEPPHVHRFDHDRAIEHHAVIDAVVHATAPGYLAVLVPYRAGETLPEGDGQLPTSAVDLGDGVVAWSVENGDTTDLFLLRDSTAPETFTLPDGEVLATDGAFAALRLVGSELFAVLARGTSLTLDGSSIISDGDPDGVTIVE